MKMKMKLIAGEVLILSLAMGCGSQSSKKATAEAETSPNAIPLTAVQSNLVQQPGNLMSCHAFLSDSVICAYSPDMKVIQDTTDVPTLIKLNYSLMCHEGETKSLSTIAVRTDTQVRRLQVNVENRKISVLSLNGAKVNLAKVLQNEVTMRLEGDSNCWYLKVDVVGMQAFANTTEAEGAAQQADQQAQADNSIAN
ncbi:MAG: hypothetical protein H7318_06755 [Oligoflexus sp.]|nr:hypothetical protein [Oligoflexus sp.]